MNLTDLWAKSDPFQSVLTHGKICGYIVQLLWNEYLPEGSRKQLSEELNWSQEDICKMISYLASLHDIGKISFRFQSKIKETFELIKKEGLEDKYISSANIRHEKTTHAVLMRIWSQHCNKRDFRVFAEILQAHHQGKIGEAESCSKEWEAYQDEYESKMRDCFRMNPLRFPSVSSKSQGILEAYILSIIILADWIASGDLFSKAESWGNNIEKMCCERTHRFICESGLTTEAFDFGDTFHDVWPNIPKGSERQLQLETENLFLDAVDNPLLVLIEAPMGEGKTEAGVYAAIQMGKKLQKCGFYIGLPTAATANQMILRIRSFLELHEQQDRVKLLHSMAWLSDSEDENYYGSEEERYISSWLTPTRRGLLAPYAVGTVDQALMTALFVKYGVLRLLGLSCKSLIIDEVHAYDLYMTEILDRLLVWCCALQIPVVLLSATLPPEKKRELLSIYTDDAASDAYPMITAVSGSRKLMEHPFDRVTMRQDFQISVLYILHNAAEIARTAMAKVSDGGCCCIILNTVKQVQETFIDLNNFDGELIIFHSQFPAEQRDEIEKKCISMFGKGSKTRPTKAILVATQVIEQSLDVDFDIMLSAIAPIDLLLQRMGRLFRHAETIRPSTICNPELIVLTPKDKNYGSDGYVYPTCILRQSEHLLTKITKIRVPDDMAKLVKNGYDSSAVLPEELENWINNLAEDQVKASMADKFLLSMPDKKLSPLFQSADFNDLEEQSYLSAKTRLSEPTVRVALLDSSLHEEIIACIKNGRAEVRKKALAQAVIKNSVSVSEKKLTRMLTSHKVMDITCDMLLTGVRVLHKDNPVIEFNRALGLIWKGEYNE